jgi:hypothetical protein
MMLSYYGNCQQENSNVYFENNEMKEAAKPLEIIIYPNPIIGNCYIKGEIGAICTVYSSEGTYVGKWDFYQSDTIVLTDLPIGVFQLFIEKDEKKIIKRIIVM